MSRISGDRDANWFYFNMQKMVRSPQMRKRLAKIEASFKDNSDPSLFTQEILAISDELAKHGKSQPLDLISADKVEEMYQYMKGKDWIDRSRSELGSFSIDEVPDDTQLAHLQLEDVLYEVGECALKLAR